MATSLASFLFYLWFLVISHLSCSTTGPETEMMEKQSEQNFIDPHQLTILVLNNYWEHLGNEVTRLVKGIKDLMPGCDLPEVQENNMRHI